MALTRDFRELVKARLDRDPNARQALLRDCINATVGFEELGKATGTPPKNLMRMFGPRGNPTASKLLAVVGHLQKRCGIAIEVRNAR